MSLMIRAASLRGFASLVEELGGDPYALADRFAIPASALTGEPGGDDVLVPITGHDLMLDAAAAELGCPDLGLRLAARQDLNVLGRLALAVRSSSTAAEALACGARFLFVHSPALAIGIEPDPRGRREVVALTYRKDLAESPYSPQAIELGLGVFHRVAVALLDGAVGLRSVEIPHQPLSPVARYLEHFGADVKFGSPAAALRVERRVLDRGFDGADENLRRLAIDYLTRHHTDPERQVSTHVRRAVVDSIGTSTPSLEGVAQLFGLHPRTLQRRLAAEGTTFAAVLDDVRESLAVRYLTTTDLPIAEVAAMAGFADQATLSHAVRRWRDLPPREVRALARSGVALRQV